MHNIHKVYFKQELLIIKNTLKDKSLIQQEADVQSNENVEKLIVSFVPTIQKQEKSVAYVAAKANHSVYEEKISATESYGIQRAVL